MYFVIENHTNIDGSINTETTVRQTFASGLSYYHERYSKMVMTELYRSVSLLLVDANLNKVEHATIKTQYKEQDAYEPSND